jgi:hypothetical protein
MTRSRAAHRYRGKRWCVQYSDKGTYDGIDWGRAGIARVHRFCLLGGVRGPGGGQGGSVAEGAGGREARGVLHNWVHVLVRNTITYLHNLLYYLHILTHLCTQGSTPTVILSTSMREGERPPPIIEVVPKVPRGLSGEGETHRGVREKKGHQQKESPARRLRKAPDLKSFQKPLHFRQPKEPSRPHVCPWSTAPKSLVHLPPTLRRPRRLQQHVDGSTPAAETDGNRSSNHESVECQHKSAS